MVNKSNNNGSGEPKKIYNKQLETWINQLTESKGYTREQIGTFGIYFDIDPKNEPKVLKPWDMARLVGDKPKRSSKKYSLYTLLGILYAHDVVGSDGHSIDKNGYREFLELHKISFPPQRQWEGDIWEDIEEGAQKCRKHIQNNVLNVSSQSKAGLKRHKIFIGVGIVIFLIFVSAGLFAFQINTHAVEPNRTNQNGTNVSDFNCSPPQSAIDPTFNNQEGYHLYQTGSGLRESSVLSNAIRTVRIDERGVWIGYKPDESGIDGVSYFNNGMWTHCPGINFTTGQAVNDFAFTDDGTVWVATDGIGVARLDKDNWQIYSNEHGLPSNAVYSLVIDDDGTLWATSYEGIAKLIGEHWVTEYRNDGMESENRQLTSNHIMRLARDPQGNLWLGAIGDGITQITPAGEWLHHYQSEDGLRNIRDIYIDNEDGSVWFATDGGGVLHYINDNWQVLLEGSKAQSIQQDQFGRIWVATYDQGLVYTPDEGTTWETYISGNVLDVAIGCDECAFDSNHLWFVIDQVGLEHARIPPLHPVVEVLSVSERPQLKPGETFIFSIEVQVLSESLRESNDDSLFNVDPPDTNLYGAHPVIGVRGEVEQGAASYTFTNEDDPIIAPTEPGMYQQAWRIWQGKRFVSDPIIIEFEVIDE